MYLLDTRLHLCTQLTKQIAISTEQGPSWEAASLNQLVKKFLKFYGTRIFT